MRASSPTLSTATRLFLKRHEFAGDSAQLLNELLGVPPPPPTASTPPMQHSPSDVYPRQPQSRAYDRGMDGTTDHSFASSAFSGALSAPRLRVGTQQQQHAQDMSQQSVSSSALSQLSALPLRQSSFSQSTQQQPQHHSKGNAGRPATFGARRL